MELLGYKAWKMPLDDGVGTCLKQAIKKNNSNLEVRIYKMFMTWFYTFKKQWVNFMLHMKVPRKMLNGFFGKWRLGMWIEFKVLTTKTMLGSQHMHSMQVVNALRMSFWRWKVFSCFFRHCIDITLGNYISKGYVEPWRLVTLELCHSRDVFCDVEYDETDWGVGVDSNELVVGLKVGDNFVVVVALGNMKVLISSSCNVSSKCTLCKKMQG